MGLKQQYNSETQCGSEQQLSSKVNLNLLDTHPLNQQTISRHFQRHQNIFDTIGTCVTENLGTHAA